MAGNSKNRLQMLNMTSICKLIDYKEAFTTMSNLFNLPHEEQCLGSLKEQSQHNSSEMFMQQSAGLKIQSSEHPKSMTEPHHALRDSTDPASNSKSRKKAFYRDKMISITGQEYVQSRFDYSYGEHSREDRNGCHISREERLRRGRQSAKHSRQRRKQYLETLEVKNQQDQKKIQQLTIRLREAEMERDRLKEDNRSYMKTFMAAKNEAYQNLHDLLHKNGKKSSDQLSEELQMMMARYGAAGSERVAATEYYMKQIIEILLADIHKYLVDCAVNDSGLFGLGEWSKFDDQICNILKVNKEARVRLSRNYKQQMMQQFETFKAVSQKFYDAYRVVQNQAKIIEKIFTRISVEFNDACIADLILWLESNKFSKELKRIRADWARSVEQPEQPNGRPRKMHHSSLHEH